MEAVVVIIRDITPDVFGLDEIIDDLELILLEIPTLLTGDTLPEIIEGAFGEEASAYGSVIGSFAGSALDYTLATNLGIGATENPQGNLNGSEEFQSISTESAESRYELLAQDLSETIEEESFSIQVEGDQITFEEHTLTIPYGAFLDSVVEQASLAAGIEATDTKSLFLGLVDCDALGELLGPAATITCIAVKPAISLAIGDRFKNLKLELSTSGTATRKQEGSSLILEGTWNAGLLSIPFRAVRKQ